MGIISLFSTECFAVDRTGHFFLPALQWLLPHASLATLGAIHIGIRKAAHLMEYGTLALVVYYSARGHEARRRGTIVIVTFVIAAAFAGLHELHQALLSSRTASLRDVGLDSLGAAIGSLLGSMIQRASPSGFEGAGMALRRLPRQISSC